MPVAVEQDFVVKRPTESDIPAIYDLMVAADKADTGEVETQMSEVVDTFRAPDFNPKTDAWMVHTPEGQLVAFASMSELGKPVVHGDGYVHPDYRGRGLGAYLLEVEEKRAREELHHVPEGIRAVLQSGVLADSKSAAELHELKGFQVIRHFWREIIEQTEAPSAPVWPEGITVRSYVPGQDDRAIHAAHMEAFRDHWGFTERPFDKWIEMRTKGDNFDPNLWFFAMDGDEIAAYALCRAYETDGWVDTLGVRRRWRKRGIGLALLKHAFGEFWKRGLPTVELGVDAQNLTGATRLYEQAGMHVARVYTIYEKELQPGVDTTITEIAE